MSVDPFSPQNAANPKYWRDKAEEVRVLAEKMQDRTAIETMLRASLEYERLAAIAEDLRRSSFTSQAKFFRADD
jgi:hypothetical protein